MVDNTITDAASLFRTSLLAEILPYPKQVGAAFHDHWIGLVAPLKGDIGYVDRALYDYVQHATSVIGHNYYKGTGTLAAAATLVRAFRRPHGVPTVAAQLLKQAADDHVFVMQKVVLALTLLLSNPVLAPERRAALKRFTRLDTSLFAAFCEKTAALLARRHSLNLEGLLLWFMIGARLRNVALRCKQAKLRRQQIDRPGQPLLGTVGGGAPPPLRKLGDPDVVPVLEYSTTKWIYRNVLPLTLDVSAQIRSGRICCSPRSTSTRYSRIPDGEAGAIVFSNAIQAFHPTRDRLTRRRRLLFYSRQEEHVSRNLFELGMIALAMLVQDPRVDLSGWSFHGIGSMGGNTLGLKPGLPFELVQRPACRNTSA